MTIRSSVRARFARFISIAFHPFMLFPVAVSLVTAPRLSQQQQSWVLGGIAMSFFCVSVYVGVQMKRGVIGNIDVSKREQRPALYAVAIASTLACAALFHFLVLPQSIVQGALISAGLLTVALIANTKLKVSLHMAYTIFAIGIGWPALPSGIRAFSLVLIVLMGWSRVEMKRHTLPEVIAGAVLGSLAVVALMNLY